jgi:hypothetical protein
MARAQSTSPAIRVTYALQAIVISCIIVVFLGDGTVSADDQADLSRGGQETNGLQITREEVASQCQTRGGKWIEQYDECELLVAEDCAALEGEFEECLSVCRHDADASACVKMCVPVCRFNFP